MRRSLIFMIVLSAGCQSVMLRERTVGQAKTITDVYYQQIMDNIAIHAANPEALPYFSYPSTGSNAIQRTLTGFYQPGWNLVHYAALGPAIAYHYLFNQQSAQLNASSQSAETWTTVTTTDPDKIQLMKYAYEKAFGIVDAGHDHALWQLLHVENPDDENRLIPAAGVAPKVSGIQGGYGYGALAPKVNLDYYSKIYPGWFSVGAKCDVPKDACFVGHCGKTYAWVMPNQMRDLANFTLVILDIATYQSSGTRNPSPGSFGYPGILPPPPR